MNLTNPSLIEATSTAQKFMLKRQGVVLDADLLDEWRTHMKSKGLSPNTVRTYIYTANAFAKWVAAQGDDLDVGLLSPKHVTGWLASLFDAGRESSYVAKHYRQLQQFFLWAVVHADVIPVSPMYRLAPPKIAEKVVPVIPQAELDALFAVLKGNTFERRRDDAIVRFLLDSGVRAAELIGIEIDWINFDDNTCKVVGKGNKERDVVFSRDTAASLRKYLRARKLHRDANSKYLWLGKKGQLTTSGVRLMLNRRVREAGVGHINPHRFRHTFSHLFKVRGGRTEDLMALNGWTTETMAIRYGKSANASRAIAAYKEQIGEA